VVWETVLVNDEFLKQKKLNKFLKKKFCICGEGGRDVAQRARKGQKNELEVMLELREVWIGTVWQ